MEMGLKGSFVELTRRVGCLPCGLFIGRLRSCFRRHLLALLPLDLLDLVRGRGKRNRGWLPQVCPGNCGMPLDALVPLFT